MAEYSREIARRYGYDETELNDIYMMGLLHDIGKTGIPDAIINKPGKLTPEEYDIIKKHPTMGGIILDNISEKPELSMGARWHHERFGGGHRLLHAREQRTGHLIFGKDIDCRRIICYNISTQHCCENIFWRYIS